jgi:phosphatidate cytidylyltransferase
VAVLKQRVITAIIFIVLLGAAIIFLPANVLVLLLSLLVLTAAWEWAGLAGLSSTFSKSGFTLALAALMVATLWYTRLLDVEVSWVRVQDVLGLGCLWWAIALLWVSSYPASAVIWQSTLVRIAMGFVTLLPAWLAVIYLRLHDNGIALIFIIIALVAAADIGAYFSGKAWGKAKLAARVSPGKSWAGFWGGLVATSILAAFLWLAFADSGESLWAVMAIAMVTTLASVLGDLLESMVKRQQGVKDSGTILPGHGGLMDRMDSITAAAPVFALCLMLVGW